MKKSTKSEQQIVAILKKAEAGSPWRICVVSKRLAKRFHPSLMPPDDIAT